jgi:AraC-like DNA-binding protein
LADETRPVHAGEVLVVPSGVAHGYVAVSGEEVECMTVQFPEVEHTLLSQLVNAPPLGRFRLSDLEISRFTDMSHPIQREIASALPYAEVQCQALTNQLVVLLLRSCSQKGLQQLTHDQQRAMERALQWIHRHAHEHILVSEVAAHVGLSPVHFRRLFRDYIGVSPKRYLLALQLQLSKCLLMQAHRTVSEVALLAGFGSPQQFAKIFRHLIGLTPKQWQEAHLMSSRNDQV